MRFIYVFFVLINILACVKPRTPAILVIDESDSACISNAKFAKFNYENTSEILINLQFIKKDGVYYISKKTECDSALFTQIYSLYKLDFHTRQTNKILEEIVIQQGSNFKYVINEKNYAGYNNYNYLRSLDKNYSFLYYYLTFVINNGIVLETNFDYNKNKCIFLKGDIMISSLTGTKVKNIIKADAYDMYTCVKFSNNGNFVVLCSCADRKVFDGEVIEYTISVYDEKGNEVWEIISEDTPFARVSNDGNYIIALKASNNGFNIHMLSKNGQNQYIGHGKNAFFLE